ncbi:DUF523 domain-containing protein [uncultured Phascolarctobacterium sp.]|uniref:DUF523 domain-containing protein n=1 Tax=Phascolarctobacterium sp. TaxID=2049039 RepID=UPI0025FF0400|nr:DUF523 domain-containing protein [uncultured Phascolarctobacterium sp.]
MVLVSSCLLGQNVKYSGGSNYCQLLAKYDDSGLLLPVCPECLGQLLVPRPPAEIEGGTGRDVLAGAARVYSKDGSDLTANFISGAEAVLKLAQQAGVKYAILKARSPSCGAGKVYNGSFDGTLINGDGVTTALLKQYGITVYTELDLTAELLEKLLGNEG